MAAPEPADVLVHQALLYGSAQQFVDVIAPLLRDGLDRGDSVVVISRRAGLIGDALGGDAAGVEFIDPAGWFGAPARTLTAYLMRARERWWPKGRLCLVAEPVWDRRTPLDIREWMRLESMLNVAFAGTPSRVLCPYDLRELPVEITGDVGRTHPELVGCAGSRTSTVFEDPAEFYARANRIPLPPPVEPVHRRAFGAGGLTGLRDFVADAALRHGLSHERSFALAHSVIELAAGAVRHGAGRGSVRLWADGDELLCDVIDEGGVLDDRFLGYFPPTPYRPADAGMWAVRQLCDIVEIRTGPTGTVIRLHMRGARVRQAHGAD